MSSLAVHLVALLTIGAAPLVPGDHTRTFQVGGRERSYLVHIPPKHDPQKPTPVVLAFHGAMTNAPIMALASGLDAKADEAGFIVVYPNGTGKGELLLVWNSGGFRRPDAEKLPDDVAFVGAILDELPKLVHVDPKRVHATGISNGGMMCYRLAAELSQRIADSCRLQPACFRNTAAKSWHSSHLSNGARSCPRGNQRTWRGDSAQVLTEFASELLPIRRS